MSLTGERGGQGGRLSSRAVEHIGCVILPEIRDCTIVTWDDEDETDGIRIVPAWKWLLA